MKKLDLIQLEELLNSLSEKKQSQIKGGNIVIEEDVVN